MSWRCLVPAGVLLYSGQFWQVSMVSNTSVFHCTLMFINRARLFHYFQNVKWFALRWIICHDDVECILITFNDLYTIYDTLNYLYYFQWFVLSWIICTYKIESVLAKLKDLHCCWMIWTVQWNFLLENISRNIALEISLLWKSQPWTLPHKKTPL